MMKYIFHYLFKPHSTLREINSALSSSIYPRKPSILLIPSYVPQKDGFCLDYDVEIMARGQRMGILPVAIRRTKEIYRVTVMYRTMGSVVFLGRIDTVHNPSISKYRN